ncbi:MAG: hypothetical protein DRJ42_07975, partial [Deltaproteobacteria bacterium]
ASLPPAKPPSSSLSPESRVLPARAGSPEKRRHSPTTETLSGAPGPRTRWPLWLGVFALATALAIAVVFASM